MRSFSHSKHEIRAERIELQNFFGYSKVAAHVVFFKAFIYTRLIFLHDDIFYLVKEWIAQHLYQSTCSKNAEVVAKLVVNSTSKQE